MLAYHNDQNIKDGVISEMAKHREADNLIQGYGYWKDGKGCAVGCLIKNGNHAEYETKFGIPGLLARLEDGIFEGLPVEDAKLWPERFLSAIRPGADLSMVFYHFMHWLLVDGENGIIKFAKTDKSKKAINDVANLYAQHIAGNIPTRGKCRAAAAAAYAAYDDADAYAAAAAAYAAYDAAYAYAAYDAAYAAYAAAAAYAADAADADAYAAYDAARQKARIAQADKLIELLQSA